MHTGEMYDKTIFEARDEGIVALLQFSIYRFPIKGYQFSVRKWQWQGKKWTREREKKTYFNSFSFYSFQLQRLFLKWKHVWEQYKWRHDSVFKNTQEPGLPAKWSAYVHSTSYMSSNLLPACQQEGENSKS